MRNVHKQLWEKFMNFSKQYSYLTQSTMLSATRYPRALDLALEDKVRSGDVTGNIKTT